MEATSLTGVAVKLVIRTIGLDWFDDSQLSAGEASIATPKVFNDILQKTENILVSDKLYLDLFWAEQLGKKNMGERLLYAVLSKKTNVGDEAIRVAANEHFTDSVINATPGSESYLHEWIPFLNSDNMEILKSREIYNDYFDNSDDIAGVNFSQPNF